MWGIPLVIRQKRRSPRAEVKIIAVKASLVVGDKPVPNIEAVCVKAKFYECIPHAPQGCVRIGIFAIGSLDVYVSLRINGRTTAALPDGRSLAIRRCIPHRFHGKGLRVISK